MPSNPESRRRTYKARTVFYRSNNRVSLAGEFMRDSARVRKHVANLDNPEADPEPNEWRHRRSDFGCCRLENVATTPNGAPASARQLLQRLVSVLPGHLPRGNWCARAKGLTGAPTVRQGSRPCRGHGLHSCPRCPRRDAQAIFGLGVAAPLVACGLACGRHASGHHQQGQRPRRRDVPAIVPHRTANLSPLLRGMC